MTIVSLLLYNFLTMLQTVRISSKRQITIPAQIYRQLSLSQGDRLSISVDNSSLIMKKSKQLLNELAGSVIIPKRYKNKSIDFIIKEAKKVYFTQR